MNGPLILVVEDNRTLLDGLRDLLHFSGYRVLTAIDAKEALVLLETRLPDLIISDIMMPEIDGYQFHAQVRRRPELIDIPFIFLTARGEDADVRKGKELGVDDYITKPFSDEDLLVAIRSKLARWSDLRRAQEEEIADIKHKILVMLSHEFRTPLAYVVNYAQLLEADRERISPEDFEQFITGIKKGAMRLHRLVEDFITLVELETGEAANAYRLRRAEIPDFSAWLRTVARRCEDAAIAAGLELRIDVPDGLPDLVVDEVYLADAIGRLLDNAIKFTRGKNKQVRFVAEVRGDRLWISVEDQGQGIPPNELDAVFDAMHQIDRAKREQQGTGSGLAICKGIVELHGGRVHVESRQGVGSTFTVELPLRS
jgi:two-component system sensor histidine kinase/response regulator